MRSKLTAILIMGIAALYGCGGTVIGDSRSQGVDALGDRLDRLTVNGVVGSTGRNIPATPSPSDTAPNMISR